MLDRARQGPRATVDDLARSPSTRSGPAGASYTAHSPTPRLPESAACRYPYEAGAQLERCCRSAGLCFPSRRRGRRIRLLLRGVRFPPRSEHGRDPDERTAGGLHRGSRGREIDAVHRTAVPKVPNAATERNKISYAGEFSPKSSCVRGQLLERPSSVVRLSTSPVVRLSVLLCASFISPPAAGGRPGTRRSRGS